MLTKEDLLKLSKERLAELLLEEWSKMELPKPFDILVPKDVYIERRDCFHGGPCTNPHYDCVNCPRQFSGGGTISTNGTIQTFKQVNNE